MFSISTRELKKLDKSMANAESFSQWRDVAQTYDERSGASKWRQLDRTKLYDYAQIRRRLDSLRLHRARQDNHALLFTLNEGIHGNMGGMGNASLYQPAKYGTKNLIEDYVAEIVDALDHIANLDDTEISREEKLDFFHRASHCYGRTALMLSGGGALGHFHIGVVKALLEQDLLPNVISGSSAGSLVTGIFGTHTTRELEELIQPVRLIAEAKEEATWIDKMLFGKEAQIDIHDLEELIARLVPDLTFQEAFDLTGRSINISVAPAELHQTSRLLNAIASPNVFIRKAVLASCAVPGVYPPVMLEAKNVRGERQPYLPTRRWVDGSVTDDLPAKRLSRLYGVNHSIASLINPIVLFSQGGDREHTRIPKSLRDFMHKRASNLARSSTAFSKRYSENWPRFNIVISMVASILNQEYSADINVYPDFRTFKLRKILSHLSEDELLMLVRQGEASTWKQIERIRTSTAISRKLDQVLEQYGEEELRHTARKRKQKKIRANKTAEKQAAVTAVKKAPKKKKATARKRPAKQATAEQTAS